MLPLLDKLGGPETDPHYPMGWAMAGNAPLKRWQEDDIWELYHTDRAANGAVMVVMVDTARVIKTDLETSNGVIHVIDTVVLP